MLRRLPGPLLVLVLLAAAGGTAAKKPPANPPPGPATPAWLRVEYGALVDARRITHSGEAVGAILARLGGRPRPADGDRSADGLDHRLLDPIIEPYAFVLADALDARSAPHDPPLVDIGGLWEPGGAEPAWVELCRARHFLVESDGQGFLRVFLPAPGLDALPFDDALPSLEAEKVAQEAWKVAWPVLRHVLAAERRRLSHAKGAAAPPPLDVEVHPYRHLISRSAFVVGATGWRTRVESTAADGGSAPLDLGPLRAILERGATIEGARLEPSGRLRFMTADPDRPPRILGRAPQLSDLAVAYRAVAHGGYGEAYMSLDRAEAPHVAEVNYGGRLRDTALGMVSMLSDVRFKTFSVGIDLLGEGDARASIRKTVPDFKTHLERFAADPTAGAVLNQQTRFWFYPDDVDLTLSAEGDVLAFRRVKMAAASERVEDAATKQADPAWTRAMVGHLNERHEELGSAFPEIAALDESVRYLALFTWLQAARARGLAVPDLDVLLDVELPAVPTPRRFPQLLSYDVLPPSGSEDPVLVFDRTAIGDALDRLRPREGKLLAPPVELQRTLVQLDKRDPDQAAQAAEMEKQSAGADPWVTDRLAYRAQRLLLHTRVLATLPAADKARVDERRTKTPATRVFSVGIGGIDLGMSAVLARATTRTAKMGLAGLGTAAPSSPSRAASAPTAAAPAVDPATSAGNELPDHGLGPVEGRTLAKLEQGRGEVVSRARPGTVVRKGSWKIADGKTATWEETRGSVEGTEARMRRLISSGDAAGAFFERLEDGRYLSYRFEGTGGMLRAAPQTSPLSERAIFETVPQEGSEIGTVPEGLVVLDLLTPVADISVAPVIKLRVRAAPDRQLTADVPRGLLQRLVLGREADTAPDRPLAAFTPARQVLGEARTMMVLQTPNEIRPPWMASVPTRPGEEDAARIARALTVWWGADPANGGAVAVVGATPASPARWASSPKLDGSVAVIEAGKEGERPAGRLVVVVSAEAPGVLGRRLRSLAREPGMKGATLAVASLGGPMRGDLPASLLEDGQLAAVGVADDLPQNVTVAADRVRAWAKHATDTASKGKRAEEIPGPFTWYY